MLREYRIRVGKLLLRGKYCIRLRIMRRVNFRKDYSDCYFRRIINEIDIIDL